MSDADKVLVVGHNTWRAKYTRRRAELIITAIRLGATREGAASAAGISSRCLRSWLQAGRRGQKPYSVLWNKIQINQRAAEKTALDAIHRAVERGTWQAAAWILERRWPNQWAQKIRVPDAEIERRVQERLDALLADARRRALELVEQPAVAKQLMAAKKGEDE